MKDIPGYETLYACDKNGIVYSLPRIIKKSNGWNNIFEWHLPLKKLKSCTRKDGYKGLNLRKNSKAKSMLVHRLIAMTFLDLKHNQEINHKDGNKTNNRLENLEICSRSYNVRHSFNIGLRSHKDSNHPQFFITEEIKQQVLDLLKQGFTQQTIADKVKIHQTTVSQIKLGNYPRRI